MTTVRSVELGVDTVPVYTEASTEFIVQRLLTGDWTDYIGGLDDLKTATEAKALCEQQRCPNLLRVISRHTIITEKVFG